MAVAESQRREKPEKIEQRKGPRTEWGPPVKQTAFLASPVYIGQAQEEEKNLIGAKTGPEASPLFTSFGLASPHASKIYFPFFLNKTEL